MKKNLYYLSVFIFLFPQFGLAAETASVETTVQESTDDYSPEQRNTLYFKTLLDSDSDEDIYSENPYKDLDQDGVVDKYDFCQNSEIEFKVGHHGCRLDTDKDGIYDENDFCQKTPKNTKVNFLGCELDDDGDRVVNSLDRCLYTPVGAVVNSWGCNVATDYDGDGVLNENDKCPNTAENVLVNKYGCKPTALTISNVLFDTGIYFIRSDQKTILDNETQLLRRLTKDEVILLKGFTDSVGSIESNMKLSWNRSQQVKNYLVSRLGYDKDNIILVGKGEKYPLNKEITADDRQQNRRVEITILLRSEAPVKSRSVIPEDMKNYIRFPVKRLNHQKAIKELELPY